MMTGRRAGSERVAIRDDLGITLDGASKLAVGLIRRDVASCHHVGDGIDRIDDVREASRRDRFTSKTLIAPASMFRRRTG